MDKETREIIGSQIRYELQEGTHTFSMCRCNRRGCRSMCWECLLERLEEGKFTQRKNQSKGGNQK